jgi:hypothetical protein
MQAILPAGCENGASQLQTRRILRVMTPVCMRMITPERVFVSVRAALNEKKALRADVAQIGTAGNS